MTIFQTVRHAQQTVWPVIRVSLDLHRAARDAYRANPAGATTAAATRAEKPWTRVVADEAVWAVAKQGLLLSEESTAVIEAAKKWAKLGPVGSDLGDDPEDIELYEAVQTLASSLAEMNESDPC